MKGWKMNIPKLIKSKKHIDQAKVSIDVKKNVAVRPRLEDMRHLGPAVEAKLYSMLYQHGPGNGTGLFMPFDQKSSEHGPGHEYLWDNDFSKAEDVNLHGRGSADMRAIAELVNKGNFSGYVLHPGNVRQFKHLFRPDIPLIYKIDGHMTQPKAAGFMSTVGSVKDAVRYGASAIGLTIYPGGHHVQRDLERAGAIIREAHCNGLAAVVWSYARGPGLDSNVSFKDDKGKFGGMTQADSLFWAQYAVSVASGLLGADIVKTKFPKPVKPENRRAYDAYISKLAKKNNSMAAYQYLEPKDPKKKLTDDQTILRASLVVQTAPHAFVIFSGGPKPAGNPTESLKKQSEIIMKAGGEGGIYGRNIWGLPVAEGVKAGKAIMGVMSKKEYSRVLTQPRFQC